MQLILLILLLVAIALLININSKLPKRDYVKEALERDRQRRIREKHNL